MWQSNQALSYKISFVCLLVLVYCALRDLSMENKKKRVEIISTTIIRPSSPTPHHKRHLKLSLFDQTLSRIFAPVIFFYNAHTDRPSLTILSLQNSLSKALELFYPFAGQLDESLTFVDCNDYGAYFLEAEFGSKLSDFLRNPNPRTVFELLPLSNPITTSEATRNNIITLVKVTTFSCGGIAIAIQVSHKISDGYSVSFFAKTWTAISSGKRDVAPPVFPGAALLPPLVFPIKRIAPYPQVPLRSERFVFSAEKLTNLKKKVQENGGVDFRPSTLEAVSSLLFNCVAEASGDAGFIQMVNLRNRLTPSLPENCIGNFAWFLIVSDGKNRRVMELHEIAMITRKGLSEFFSHCREERLKGEAHVSMVSRFTAEEAKLAMAGIRLYLASFVSSFRLYETDFGWGDPAWVTAPFCYDKRFLLMHSKSGKEIEVWETLEETFMAKFERNEELLAYVSVNSDAPAHCRM